MKKLTSLSKYCSDLLEVIITRLDFNSRVIICTCFNIKYMELKLSTLFL